MMQRRNFLQLLSLAGLTPFTAKAATTFTPYSGPYYIVISADGGWDVTSFCDPKVNQIGEKKINTWADTQGIQTIANSAITYAPFANNALLFNDHHAKMLVVNGIDSQTNAHNAGIRHNWSGRFDEGYPAFAALTAAIHGSGLPLAYLSNGGYRETANLVNYTLMQNPSSLANLVEPNAVYHNDARIAKQYHRPDQAEILQRYKKAHLSNSASDTSLLPRMTRAIASMQNASEQIKNLALLTNALPASELVTNIDEDGKYNPLRQQAQLALRSMKAGLTVSADLRLGGFDTHANHDTTHADHLGRLVRGIHYLWAEADAIGIADKLTVFITSDFSRTNFYNDGGGKDHWPVNSAIFMQQNPTWGDTVLGSTDPLHTANTYGASDIILQPKHVQQALRDLAGISSHPLCQKFPLSQSGEADYINLFGDFPSV